MSWKRKQHSAKPSKERGVVDERVKNKIRNLWKLFFSVSPLWKASNNIHVDRYYDIFLLPFFHLHSIQFRLCERRTLDFHSSSSHSRNISMHRVVVGVVMRVNLREEKYSITRLHTNLIQWHYVQLSKYLLSDRSQLQLSTLPQPHSSVVFWAEEFPYIPLVFSPSSL